MALDLSYRAIDADTATRDFRCGERELDQFFARKAKKQHDRGTILTTCSYLPGIAAPVGFYSIASVAEEVRNLPNRPYHRLGDCEHFPAMQLVYLAVHRAHQGRGIGSAMAGAVIELFADAGQKLGIPHLILVPINDDVIPFYEGQLGFTCYRDRCMMFLPLRDAVLAMQTPPANETGDLFEAQT
jgi:GNAT superfamily N-acetyltransferase